jgi:hypothetical protein
MFNLPSCGIHEQLKNSLQAFTGKPLSLAHEEFLLSLEFFSLAAVFYLLAVLIGCIEKQQAIPKHSFLSIVTMEHLSFAPGRPRHETKQQRKERLRKERDWNQKQKQKQKRRRNVCHTPLPPRSSWLLLPYHVTKGFEFWIVTLKGNTFLTKRQTLQCDIERTQKPLTTVYGFDRTMGESHQTNYLEKAALVMNLLELNQRLRWIFKKWFTALRIKRFTRLNETDPITMEPIKQPIQFASFEKQKLYTFEASTFAKHLHKKLLHNDGQIPMPQYPKNPFTNEDFTVSQIMGLVEQTRKLGHSSWALEAFVSCRYDLMTFGVIHSKPLRLHAIRETMKDVRDWDAIDTLYDFIKSQHEVHEEPFYTPTYTWAVAHAPHADRIVAWRKLCLKWYETDILMEDPVMKLRFFSELETKTLPLCNTPNDLRELKRSLRKTHLRD